MPSESDRVPSPNDYSPTNFLVQLNPMEYTRILTGPDLPSRLLVPEHRSGSHTAGYRPALLTSRTLGAGLYQ